jgi:hypothetical protein
MRNLSLLLCLSLIMGFSHCKPPGKKDQKDQKMSSITTETSSKTIAALVKTYGDVNKARIEKGVEQAAALWTREDGSNEDFEKFCAENFVSDPAERKILFERISLNLESLWGNYNQVSVELKRPLHLDQAEVLPIDEMFGAYEPSAHMIDDFFANKIAFVTILNFPFFSLEEKNKLGAQWSRSDWAYARLGDLFISRVPAELLLKSAEAATNSDTYISDYNINMGNLLDQKGKNHFPVDMKLISHWGLRDELKANYGQGDEGLLKQQMIYEVMKRIIQQDIPDSVINNSALQWNPYTNKVFKEGKEVSSPAEPDTRYAFLLGNFNALKEIDAYSPHYPTYIKRKFEQEMEIPQEEVEKLFTDFISSPQVKKVASLISQRLNRKLQPFDIWYDGFKARSSIGAGELDKKTKAKYPNREAFEKDLPNILKKLGFKDQIAAYICDKIAVDASRGAGHAWGALMKSDKARLRTRIQADGMDYKGYNIAIHEFGHNVEQTISLFDVDYYMLNGVPNTAFTEALAFIFQKRDLELLGIPNDDPDKWNYQTIDNFWSCYEIMGVSLVDMQVWKWMYENPKATPAELKAAVIRIATEVWNQYYAEVFGVKDQPILAIYSHMIDAPLYLSAYPIGHLIEFQLEEQIKGKSFADEVYRIFKGGRLSPEFWMKNAVGDKLSIAPMLKATDQALADLEKKD